MEVLTISQPDYNRQYLYYSTDKSFGIPAQSTSNQGRQFSTVASTLGVPNYYSCLIRLNHLMSYLITDYSHVAFENAISITLQAVKAGAKPHVTNRLEANDGVFLDFTIREKYFAFEIYNSGEIVMIKKNREQPSEVTEITDLTGDVFK